MAETEAGTGSVTITKELLSRLINIANPSMPDGTDTVNEVLRVMRGPLPPTQDYYVLYRVTWQPPKVGDEGPMDSAHHLTVSDERYVDHEMVEIGGLYSVQRAITQAWEQGDLCVYCDKQPKDGGYDRCYDCRTWRDEEWCQVREVEPSGDIARELAYRDRERFIETATNP